MPIDPQACLSVDPDIDLHIRGQRRELTGGHGAVLAVIALGGALGALARYGLLLAWPVPAGGFPWAVFAINVAGSFLLGVLMVVITEIRPVHPLVRPFLGVGVLGGFTTFSTYAEDIRALLDPGTVLIAAVYLIATLVAALVATTVALLLTRAAARFARVEVAS
ncbi:fluoride efflux transporter FluC [Nocardia sp. CA-128927]|uniref:fluoride efflux transporter FluC n=1 Tax=Nocardia sp. CA-128927 TaxID=3239975 RepID=UPI003D965CF4